MTSVKAFKKLAESPFAGGQTIKNDITIRVIFSALHFLQTRSRCISHLLLQVQRAIFVAIEAVKIKSAKNNESCQHKIDILHKVR